MGFYNAGIWKYFMNKEFEKKLQFYFALLEVTQDPNFTLEIESTGLKNDFTFFLSFYLSTDKFYHSTSKLGGIQINYPFSFDYLEDWMKEDLGLSKDSINQVFSKFEDSDFLVYPEIENYG